jgi:hypothetical protein|tara:strand:+ start:253 stop:354 length:102 start_codon:yes stop_codon:yes gene_type:complete
MVVFMGRQYYLVAKKNGKLQELAIFSANTLVSD